MKRDNSLALLLCLLGFCGVGGLHDFYLGCDGLVLSNCLLVTSSG